MANYYSSRSPPPLQHPVPTHPAFIPEPPATPVSPHGYQRYTSSPPAPAPNPPYNQFQPLHTAAPQPHTQHPQAQTHAHGVPDFSAWGIDGATASLGMQLGHNAVAAGQDYVQRNVRAPVLAFALLWPAGVLTCRYSISSWAG